MKGKMIKKTNDRLRTKFAREVRFEVKPALNRVVETQELDNLKQRLLRRLLEQSNDTRQNTGLRRAANDAAALAWVTQYPLLTFPVLLEEKARTAAVQYHRQQRVRQRSQTLLLKAA